MAGVITHMVVAREIKKLLPKTTIKDMGLFYLGNLAPDAVHAREDYIRAYKKHSHFRDDIIDKDFSKQENLNLFHQRVIDFINEYRDREDGLQDLYRGYVAHILTDELFVLTLREEFCKALEQQQIAQSDPRFFEYIIADMNRNDFLLTRDYEGSEEICKCMEGACVYPIEGYISAKELHICRDWLLRQHYYEKNEFLQPRFISYEKNLSFIEMAAADIVKRLSDDKSFPKMF